MKRTFLAFMIALIIILCVSGCGISGNARNDCCGIYDTQNECCTDQENTAGTLEIPNDIPDCCGG